MSLESPNVEVIFSDDTRKKLESGINLVADAVSTTLGPRGRNFVAIGRNGEIHISKDGVSCAEAITNVEDQFMNFGVQLCKQVSKKTNNDCGDGTTTATVLARAIVKEGLKYVAAGGNPLSVKRGIDKGLSAAVNLIELNAKKIEDRQEIEYVAAISGNEPEIGRVVADAIEAVGADGIITLEESSDRETYFKYVEGFSYNQGYTSPHMVTDGSKNIVDYEDVIIIMFDGVIGQFQDIVGVLSKASEAKKPVLIIADSFSEDTTRGLALNRLRGGYKWFATKSPGFGAQKKEMILDICMMVGGKVVNMEMDDLTKVDESYYGHAKRIVSNKEMTTIIEGQSKNEERMDRIELLRHLQESTESDYERNQLNDRLAKLNGGVGVIKIGASTETELKEKKDRFEDALNATRAAIEEGVVPGGGACLLRISEALEANVEVDARDEDELRGVRILSHALRSPFYQICANGGFAADIMSYNVLNSESFEIGFDAKYGEVCNLFERGVIDPAKVTKSALINAVSIASLVLTTETLIAPVIDKNDKVLVAEAAY